MLPFGSQFIRQPNLFNTTQQVFMPQNAAVTTTASIAMAPLVLNHFSISTKSQQLPQQQMLIAPDLLKEIKKETSTVLSGSQSPKSDWTAHTTDDGRTYYYNRVTKVSSWTKPDELKSSDEIERSFWKEYKSPDGKPYYYNTKTKITTWTKPDVLSKEKSVTKKDKDTSEVKPELIHISSNTEIEKAMEATLKTMDGPENKEEKANKVDEDSTKSGKNEDENYEYEVKKRQVDKFRELLQDKCNERRINTNMSWEQASKYIQHDPRFKILGKVSERKQVFNAWKIQRTKDERDERRLAIKKAKEDLENWLISHPKMRLTLRYHKAETLFSSEPLWRAVSDSERKEIFEDTKKAISERNEEQKKQLKERNIKALSDILDGIDDINNKTTWAQAQRILIENTEFAKDIILQSMDKEDALKVFQKHIKYAEEHYMKEKEGETKRTKRQERKTREAFVQFLMELHHRGLLNSSSNWSALYPTISADQRFENMLLTTGSTALDLYKFYVEDLKNQYYQEKKIVKEILDNKGFSVTESISFDHFQHWIKEDQRGKHIDLTNLKQCYNSLFDKAVEKQKESEKELQKKQKRVELLFWELLQSLSPPIEPNSDWSQVRERIKSLENFKIIEDDEMRRKIFNEYLKSIREACGHQHGSSSLKKKKDKKKKRRHDSENEHDNEESPKKSKRRNEGDESGPTKRKKNRRQKSRSPTVSEGEIIEGR